MRLLFNIITLSSSIFLIISILVQNRGQSLGVSFGGDSSSFGTKRGAEKVIHYITIVLAVVFVLSVVLGLLSNG